MIAGGTPDQAARALDALVELQAPRCSDPALRQKDWQAHPSRSQNFFAGVQPALPLFLKRFADRLDPEDIEFVEQVVPYANIWATQMTAGPTVVIHGDYRMDNILSRMIHPLPSRCWTGASLSSSLPRSLFGSSAGWCGMTAVSASKIHDSAGGSLAQARASLAEYRRTSASVRSRSANSRSVEPSSPIQP